MSKSDWKTCINSIQQYLKQEKISVEERSLPWLLACSGGSDSVALVHLLHEIYPNLALVHVNYHKRGEESNKDEESVRKLAETYSLPFYSTHAPDFPIGNFQDAARKFRYQYFEEIRAQLGASYIVTGHHYDDVIENALFRTWRGASASAVLGLNRLHPRVLRPLSTCRKKDLIQALREKGFTWREDRSNQQPDFLRNQLRLKHIPEFNVKFPNWDKHLLQKAKLELEMTDLLLKHYAQDVKLIAENRIAVELRIIKALSETVLAQLILRLMETKGWFVKQRAILASFDLFNKQKGSRVSVDESVIAIRTATSVEYRLAVNEGALNSTAIELHDDVETVTEAGFSIQNVSRNQVNQLRNPDYLHFDFNKIRFPLVVRTWQVSDRIQPLGMKSGSKQLSDCVCESGLTGSDKHQVQVIIDANETIIAVLFPAELRNHNRISELVKVDETTNEILQLTLTQHKM